jgi:hypothetical protein
MTSTSGIASPKTFQIGQPLWCLAERVFRFMPVTLDLSARVFVSPL